ncbi:ISNCY family transposase, partial [Catenibacterium mitsuokai]
FFAGKTNCMVIETFDGQLLANIADNLYLMEEVAEHEPVSKEFDAPKEASKKEKKKYIPPMDHPWRKASFANYAAKQKHRYGATV